MWHDYISWRMPDRGWVSRSAEAAHNLDVEIADLFAQRVAIDAQKLGGANLVPAGSGKAHREKGPLDLLQHPVV